ncbi:MAG: AAA family ATPase, partial [Vicinamibacteria bacterium]
MLESLSIRNFAIVDEAEISFGPGLNVLTGETGAGKSILVSALGLALGRRAEADAIRTGASEALVEARFDISRRPDVRERAESMGIPTGESLLVSRSVTSEGRGRLHVNGRLATVAMLAHLFEGYFEIYGQMEGPDLLRADAHLEILDAAGGHGVLRAELSALADRRGELLRESESLAEGGESIDRRIELIDFQIDEIDRVKLSPGEEERLIAVSRRARAAEKLFAAAAGGHEALYAEDGAVVERLARVAKEIQSAASIDPDLSQWLRPIEEARVGLEDAARG